MRKEDKAIIIEKIASTLKEYSCFYLTDTTGMDAEQTSALRRACFNGDVKMVVVKNTLLHKALEQSETDYSELYPTLKGTTAMLFSNTGNAPAKTIKEFYKTGAEMPILKAAYVEETVYIGADQLDALSKIKSKNELIADVIALLQSPAKNVVSALQSSGNKLHGILETLSNK